MTLPSGTTISLNQVNTELSYSSTATIGLNDAAVRSLFGKSSGQISMSDGWGKSAIVYININIPNNSKNYNIFANRGGSYIATKSVVTATIQGGYVCGSTSTGTYCLYTGTGWSSGDVVNIVNNGYIAGKGGTGGGGGRGGTDNGPIYNSAGGGGGGGASGGQAYNAGSDASGGYPGNAGGAALYLQWPVNITNGSGYIYSGGGGGGGGCGADAGTGGPGGAGAGGSSAGAGGVGGSHGWAWMGNGANGAAGGLTHGAAGVGYAANAGGALGQHGGGYSLHSYYRPSWGLAGGGHGLAITTNGYSISWISGNTRVYGGVA